MSKYRLSVPFIGHRWTEAERRSQDASFCASPRLSLPSTRPAYGRTAPVNRPQIAARIGSLTPLDNSINNGIIE